MARPTKRTPTVEEKIVAAVRQGMTYKLAAAYGGISYETLRGWLKQGEEGDERFTAFFQSVRQAEAEGAMRNLEFINKAMDWRARAWVLEHRHPEEYAAKNTIKLTGDADEPIAVKTVIFVVPGEEGEEGM
jgi:transposase